VVVVSANTSWNIYNFRRPLIRGLHAAGYSVCVVAPQDKYTEKVRELGCEFREIEIWPRSTNILREIRTLYQYWRLYSSIKPTLVLQFTVKPVLYGTIAAKLLGTKVLNTITGLGAPFIWQTSVTRVIELLYKVTLRISDGVYFQNNDDRLLFIRRSLIKESRAQIIPGSGIDLNRFPLAPMSRSTECTFLFVGRGIRDKGIVEYLNATRILTARYSYVRFQLLGAIPSSRTTDSIAIMLQSAINEEQIEYLGDFEDVYPMICAATCVVLPSYREGLPRSLLEGSSTGRPLVATDVPGCRDVVVDNVSGFLCRPKDSEDLANKMEKIVLLSHRSREQMGLNGRKYVGENYDADIVVSKVLREIEEILNIV